MRRRIFLTTIVIAALSIFIAPNASSDNARDLLKKASREVTPSEDGPSSAYISTFLKSKGHQCYSTILPSKKSSGKYWIMVQQIQSSGDLNRKNFIGSAIIGTALLSSAVKWEGSDLFLGFSDMFSKKDKTIGWAIIPFTECKKAQQHYLKTSDVDEFIRYWESKIRYVSTSEPEPEM